MAAPITNAVKKATTGLAVSRNPHHTLSVLYGKILRACQQMPSDYPYRSYTEEIVKERAKLVKEEPNILKLEKLISNGQAEELIIQAENELYLSRKILEWKCWEGLVQESDNKQWKWPL